MAAQVAPVKVLRVDAGDARVADDLLVVEEPLEIRIGYGPQELRREFRLSVTMRTPGHDHELALGFLFNEGIIDDFAEVLRVVHCVDVKDEERGNVVRVELHPDVQLDQDRWQRNFYTTSSCGVCGKSSIEAIERGRLMPVAVSKATRSAVIGTLPERMRNAQTVFKHTGGIHAAALFDAEGELIVLREDIGRHNAVDKVAGTMLANAILAHDKILLVSGRAGFELVQKCVAMGIPEMAAIGAPSSLSVDLATKLGLRLIGFLREDRYNQYAPVPRSAQNAPPIAE